MLPDPAPDNLPVLSALAASVAQEEASVRRQLATMEVEFRQFRFDREILRRRRLGSPVSGQEEFPEPILRVLSSSEPPDCPPAAIVPFVGSYAAAIRAGARRALERFADAGAVTTAVLERWKIAGEEERVDLLEMLIELAPDACDDLISEALSSSHASLALAGLSGAQKTGREIPEQRRDNILAAFEQELMCAGTALEQGHREADRDAVLAAALADASRPESQFLALQLMSNRVVRGGYRPTLETLRPGLTSDHPAIRGASLLLCGRLQEADPAMALLEDTDEYVRSCAVQALGMSGVPLAGWLEERLLTERSGVVQFALLTGRLAAPSEEFLRHNRHCLSDPVERWARQSIAWKELHPETPLAVYRT